MDVAFARKVGCQIDEDVRRECVGIGEATYTTEGRTRIKITLNGNLVYSFKVWVGPMVGQDAILGMDFMVPAGIRLDLGGGALCLPDEVRIQLAGRRMLYGSKVTDVRLGQFTQLPVGGYVEVPLKRPTSEQSVLWVTRGERWVTTVNRGVGRHQFLKVTNVSPQTLRLHEDTRIGMMMAKDQIPRPLGFVTAGSRRHAEWWNLAYEATTDQDDLQGDLTEVDEGPLVDKPQYETPIHILQRPREATPVMNVASRRMLAEESPTREKTTAVTQLDGATVSQPMEATVTQPIEASGIEASVETEGLTQADDQVCTFESGELWAEEVSQGWAVIPEVDPSPQGIELKDIQIPDSNGNTPEEVDRLKQIIWKKRHLLMGKGNALPPAARGAICDIDVGSARPIAQRVRKVAPQFKEKLADLIKGLLSAKIIQPSTSP